MVEKGSKDEFGGISPSLLSAHELEVMVQIERCLARTSERTSTPKEEVWPRAEKRDDRVILLDGDRGAGKTSLMWAMVERWSERFKSSGLPNAYMDRAKRLDLSPELSGALSKPPENIRVLGILDFDPLPPSMPVVAGLVQSWRRIADKLSSDKFHEDIEVDDTLMDSWQALFRKAAAGWGKLGERKTLIDQVLDQEEQIQDWQTLGAEWRAFVDKVIASGAGDPFGFDRSTAFVIMIDDCDLQVERMREILPAIRLFHDHNVYFIVSADRSHMLDMLELDYLGQQNMMANRQIRKNPLAEEDRWARALAKASFEKVFPTVHRLRLPRLSLSEILDYPPVSDPEDDRTNFGDVLKLWEWDSESGNAQFNEKALPDTPADLSSYLSAMGATVKELSYHLPLATYRTTHQSWEKICAASDPGERTREAVARLLGGSEYDHLIGAAGLDRSAPASRRINFKQKGRLIARFDEQFSVPIGLDYRIDLSAEPFFEVLPRAVRSTFEDTSTDNSRQGLSPAAEVRRSQAILAVSLQEDSFNVQTPQLRWEMERALVWTFHYRPYFMYFSWPTLIHPSPLRLMSWAREWDQVIDAIRRRPLKDRARLIAFAWMSCQLKWTGKRTDSFELPETATDGEFRSLLADSPDLAWVPLARPEIGLPRDLQALLLENVPKDRMKEIRQERHQKITDALIAGGQALLGDHGQTRARVDQIEEEFETQLDPETRESVWAKTIRLHDRNIADTEV